MFRFLEGGKMTLLIMSSDLLLKRLGRIAKHHGERNMRLLRVMQKMDKTKLGDEYLARNEVIM